MLNILIYILRYHYVYLYLLLISMFTNNKLKIYIIDIVNRLNQGNFV
jgi:hypothetical protein